MIDKITPDTKVSEICDVLDFIQGDIVFPTTMTICRDMSGYFTDQHNVEICRIKDLNKYLKSIKKPDERDYDKILQDPAAVKKILSKLPIKDILSEISERTTK